MSDGCEPCRLRARAEKAERALDVATRSWQAHERVAGEMLRRAEKAEALVKEAGVQCAALLDDNAKARARVRELDVQLCARTVERNWANDMADAAARRIKRYEEAMSRNPAPDSGLPGALAVHAEWGWNEAYAHIRRRAGLDKSDPTIIYRMGDPLPKEFFDALRAERGPKGPVGMPEMRSETTGPLGPKGEQGQSIPSDAIDGNLFESVGDHTFRYKGPNGEPGKPAAIWVCDKCGGQCPDVGGRPLEGGGYHYDSPHPLHWNCVGHLHRHVWRDGKWVSEEKSNG